LRLVKEEPVLEVTIEGTPVKIHLLIHSLLWVEEAAGSPYLIQETACLAVVAVVAGLAPAPASEVPARSGKETREGLVAELAPTTLPVVVVAADQ
jgi:hypothetical protein